MNDVQDPNIPLIPLRGGGPPGAPGPAAAPCATVQDGRHLIEAVTSNLDRG